MSKLTVYDICAIAPLPQKHTMTNGSNDRLDQIAALLQQSVISSDERMTRLEQSMERQSQESNERMTRLEQSMAASNERLTKLSEKTDARFNQLAEQQQHMLEEADANRKVTFEMLSQMTTLQEESNRILDYLFGQQRNRNGDQPQL